MALATTVVALLVCAFGWYRAATRPTAVDALSSEQRQDLVAEMIRTSPGVHQSVWYEPDIGYTLRPDTEIEAWNATFQSNSVGYRAGPLAKAPGTFRVVFVGDSWTYGMGVERESAFPEVFARLANRHSGLADRVEAWTLALPGYNSINYLSALWFFYERLSPDAVVICPSSNDNHSAAVVMPNGSMSNAVLHSDRFGDPHRVVYRTRDVDSYRSRRRWATSFEKLSETEERLRRLDVPTLLFFLARWSPLHAHSLIEEHGLSFPYVVVPAELTLGRWRLPPPIGHATVEAHELYGEMVYRALAEHLSWPSLPAAEGAAITKLHRRPPPVDDGSPSWTERYSAFAAAAMAKEISDSFRAGRSTVTQLAGRLDLETGLMDRATTVLVSRRPRASHLRITVRRLQNAPSLYPLGLEAYIPAPDGESRSFTTVPADGPERHSFLIALPPLSPRSTTLDVVLVAERTVAAPGVIAGRSLHLESIEPISNAEESER